MPNDVQQNWNCPCETSILHSEKVGTEQKNHLKMLTEVMKSTYLYGTWSFVEGEYNSLKEGCLP